MLGSKEEKMKKSKYFKNELETELVEELPPKNIRKNNKRRNQSAVKCKRKTPKLNNINNNNVDITSEKILKNIKEEEIQNDSTYELKRPNTSIKINKNDGIDCNLKNEPLVPINIKKEEEEHIKSEENIKPKCTEIKKEDKSHPNLKSLNTASTNNTIIATPKWLKELKSQQPKVWRPPRSPHNLIEEDLYANPWQLLVATIFLNKTSCMIARPHLALFLEDYPIPERVLEARPEDLERYFVNIGLKKRATQVWRMSHDYLRKNWRDAGELYGIGKYGRDAYKMFCEGDFSVQPKDRFLRIYKAWYQMVGRDCQEEEEAQDMFT